ncbi:MAG: hypothetical protein OXE74_02355 [Cyanobacteria bacterium MAG CAR2_bin_4]|nr:hypothetical protein [Cyanobacteria bacterium MAG CAR2_bin_4]
MDVDAVKNKDMIGHMWRLDSGGLTDFSALVIVACLLKGQTLAARRTSRKLVKLFLWCSIGFLVFCPKGTEFLVVVEHPWVKGAPHVSWRPLLAHAPPHIRPSRNAPSSTTFFSKVKTKANAHF